MNESREIVLVEQARRALAEATDICELKDARDKVQAIRQYVKQHGCTFRTQQDISEAKIWIEWRLGEMLAGMDGHGSHGGNRKSRGIVTLESLDINKPQSKRWQRIASLPQEELESFVEDTRSAGHELTTARVLAHQKALANKSRNEETAGEQNARAVDALERLIDEGFKAGTIYADPPWRYGNQGTRAATDNHYGTMAVDEIAALPIAELAGDNSHLHLWTTNAFLFESKRVMDAWGYEYKSCFVWVKPEMGIGNYWRVSHEFLLLGVRGRCPFRERGLKSWESISRLTHSHKPHKVRAMVELASPAPRLELFARTTNPGWVSWGNQVELTLTDSVEQGEHDAEHSAV